MVLSGTGELVGLTGDAASFLLFFTTGVKSSEQIQVASRDHMITYVSLTVAVRVLQQVVVHLSPVKDSRKTVAAAAVASYNSP